MTGENREKVDISINVDGLGSVKDIALFEECFFETHAFAMPGSFQIVLRPRIGESIKPDDLLGKKVKVRVNGEPQFVGYVMTVETTNFFPAGDGMGGVTKLILSGTDLNILFDKTFCVPWYWETGQIAANEDLPYFDAGTMDQAIIIFYLDSYFQGFATHGVGYGTDTIEEVATPLGDPGAEYTDTAGADVTGDGKALADAQSPLDMGTQVDPTDGSGDEALVYLDQPAGGVVGSLGCSLRAFFEEISSELYSKLPGGGDAFDKGYHQAVVWYVGHDEKLHYRRMETYNAPFSIGEEDIENDVVGVREYEITHDVSNIRTEVIVYGALQTPVKFFKKVGDNVDKYGRWQAAEVKYDAANIGAVIAHGESMLRQGGNPTRTAKFALYKAGLEAGMCVKIGLTGWEADREWIPIRSVRLSFPTPWHVRYDVEASIETTGPWRYWYALSREPRKGISQPPYTNVLDESEIMTADRKVVRLGTHVNGGRFYLRQAEGQSLAEALKAGFFQTRFAYKHLSINVYLDGKHLSSGVDYVEVDGNSHLYLAGQIKMSPGITKNLKKTSRIECDYKWLMFLVKDVSYNPPSGGGLW